MNIRRRVKINVQSSEKDNDTINAKKLSRARLSLFRDDDDEDDDNEEYQTRALKKKKDQQSNKLSALEQQPQTNYDDIFTRKNIPSRGTERVLNLEDMAQEGALPLDEEEESDNGSACIPNQKVIEEVKARKLKLQRGSKKSVRDDEKLYVSLLDREDRLDIMDTIKKHGGHEEEEQLDLDLIDEERLPLSGREFLLNETQRKRAIAEAIKLQDQKASDAWETQLLSKGSSQLRQPDPICTLPKPYLSDIDDSDTDEISQAIATITLRKTQVERQLDVLRSQKMQLQQQQDTLTHRFLNWPQM